MNFKQLYVVTFILLVCFFNFKIYAADTYRLNGDYYVRGNNKDFIGTDNLVGTLLSGTEFKVIRTLPPGLNGQGMQIEILKMGARGSRKSNINKTEQIWIYKSKSDNNDFIKITDAEEAQVATATAADKETQAGVSATGIKQPCENCGGQQLNPITPQQAAAAAVPAHIQNQNNRARSTRQALVEELAQIPPSEVTVLPQIVKPEAPSTEKKSGSMDQQIANYSKSEEVKKMIDWAMKNKSPRSGGICYRKVKEAMANQCGPSMSNGYSCRNPLAPKGGRLGPGNNLLPSVPTTSADVAALSAKDRLKDFGFVNLLETEPYKSQMNSPSNAPKGAILVFSSGIRCSGTRIRDCGHVEIKTDDPGKPGYVSDYYSPDAINETAGSRKTGSPFKLVGVMIKKDMAGK